MSISFKAILITASVGYVLLPADVRAEPSKITCDMLRAVALFDQEVDPPVILEETEDGCVVRNTMQGPAAGVVRWRIGELDIQGLWEPPRDPADFASAAPPSSLEVEGRDIVQVFDTKDPVMDYQLQISQKPMAMKLDYDWDKESGAFDLHELSWAGEFLGYASVAVKAELPESVTPENWRSADARFESIRLVLENRSMIETFVIPPLFATLPRDTDPAELIARYRETVNGEVQDLPDDIASAATKEALIAFFEDFPNPTGRFEAEVGFDGGISPMEAMMRCRAPRYCLASVEVRYEPAEPWMPRD